MNIISVTATYNRPVILRDTLEILGKIKGLKKRIVVGTLAKEDGVVAQTAGAEYYEFPNNLLGAKWQHGIEQAKKYNPDAILICGSDDWITEGWVDFFYPYINNGWDVVGKSKWYTCNITKNHAGLTEFQYSQDLEPIGAGRLISRKLLDKMEWKLYLTNVNSGLDRDARVRAKELGAKILIENNCEEHIFCIKSTWPCKNSFESYNNNSFLLKKTIPNGLEVMEKYFPNRINKYL